MTKHHNTKLQQNALVCRHTSLQTVLSDGTKASDAITLNIDQSNVTDH